MSLASNQLPARAIFPTEPVFALTVENYHDMIAAGIVASDDHVELLEGALICKMGQNPPHRTAILKLQRALSRVLPSTAFGQYQAPITLERSEPEPDASLIIGTVEDFTDHHPTATAVTLVIEVSDSSLQQDRGLKRQIYADAGIATYWIVNLVDGVIEVYTRTASATTSYGPPMEFRSGQTVPVVVAGQTVGEIAVDDILT